MLCHQQWYCNNIAIIFMTSNEDNNLLFSDRLCLIIIGDLQKLVGLSWTFSDYLRLSRTDCVWLFGILPFFVPQCNPKSVLLDLRTFLNKVIRMKQCKAGQNTLTLDCAVFLVSVCNFCIIPDISVAEIGEVLVFWTLVVVFFWLKCCIWRFYRPISL